MVTKKITISLDERVLEQLERLRATTHEARSAVIARAVRMLLQRQEHEERVQAYVDAYRRQPESEADLAAADELALDTLSRVAWEEA